MDVQWDYEGIRYRHTTAETDDPDCHEPQGPIPAGEFIVHAANLYLFRNGLDNPRRDRNGNALPGLWSVERKPEFDECGRP